ncbi:MAG: hypothetical protein ACO1N0_06150 [Fluviicola sp.]
MKKFLLAALIMAGFASCKKEVIVPNETIHEYETSEGVSTKIDKKGEIACTIYNADSTSCIGKRCGTPTGDCGSSYTACRCLQTPPKSTFLPSGMSLEEFNDMWADEKGNKILRKMGYNSRDLK